MCQMMRKSKIYFYILTDSGIVIKSLMANGKGNEAFGVSNFVRKGGF